jgi:acetoacetyl-CoA reductase/3-oxoacyl-[acyl-carrier protein] reductase
MIIISGASGGIGKYLFEYYLQNGIVVYGTYFKTKPEVEYREFLHKVDISNQHDVNTFVNSIKSEIKQVTLINCAGVNYNSSAHLADIIEWQKVVNINLFGSFNMIHALLPLMREQNYGRIINLSSVLSQIGVAGTSAYSASKSALNGLVKSIAKENATKGITINNLNLGYFDIGMIQEVPENVLSVMKDKIPCKKFGDPQNILNAVNFLIRSEYVNGTSIDINGGLY